MSNCSRNSEKEKINTRYQLVLYLVLQEMVLECIHTHAIPTRTYTYTHTYTHTHMHAGIYLDTHPRIHTHT